MLANNQPKVLLENQTENMEHKDHETNSLLGVEHAQIQDISLPIENNSVASSDEQICSLVMNQIPQANNHSDEISSNSRTTISIVASIDKPASISNETEFRLNNLFDNPGVNQAQEELSRIFAPRHLSCADAYQEFHDSALKELVAQSNQECKILIFQDACLLAKAASNQVNKYDQSIQKLVEVSKKGPLTSEVLKRLNEQINLLQSTRERKIHEIGQEALRLFNNRVAINKDKLEQKIQIDTAGLKLQEQFKDIDIDASELNDSQDHEFVRESKNRNRIQSKFKDMKLF